MQFHSLKMKEINDVLKEYWRVTYKGAAIKIFVSKLTLSVCVV